MSARFPNVPLTLGVPPVLRQDVPEDDEPLTGDQTGGEQANSSVWGIFTEDGEQLTEWDSVTATEYRAEQRISNYPIEGGQFESYDKVAVPFDVTVTLTKGGDDAARGTFLRDIDDAWRSIDTYTVIMPEVTYESVNIVRYDHRRTSQGGVTLLTVEIACTQIRVAAAVEFTKSQEPAGSAVVNDGAVQTKPAPASVGKPK